MKSSEIIEALAHLSSKKKPGMMWGSPGIGKSSVINQIGKLSNRKVFDIRLALLDPTDLRGIPFYNPASGSAEWAPSSILPRNLPVGTHIAEIDIMGDDGKVIGSHQRIVNNATDEVVVMAENIMLDLIADQTAILFLDEINAAPPVVQAASYQLVLDRQIGEYRLPEGVSIIAAGNNEGDKAVTFKMPTPLLNRFTHLDFTVDFDDWNIWALNTGVRQEVVGFLKFKKGLLNDFNNRSKSKGFPTPRSWNVVSDLLSDNVSASVMRGLIVGTVGEGAASEFLTYQEVYMNIPNCGDVLDGKVAPLTNTETSACFAIMTGLSYELKARFEKLGKTEKFLDMCAQYFEFIDASDFQKEFCIMGVRDTLKNLGLPMVQAPNWGKFAKTYSKLVMAA
jgi:MoxR-like ATPase